MATSPRSRKQQAGPVRVIRQADASAEQEPIVAQDPQQDPSELEAPPVAPSYDPAMLEALSSLDWEAPSSGASSGASPAVPKDVPVLWDAATIAAADKVGFILPSVYPQTKARVMPDGSKRVLPWRLVGMPEDPERLNKPVFADVKPADRTTVKLLDCILTGFSGKLPSLADNQPLPLVYLLALFAAPRVNLEFNKNKSWRCLYNKSQSRMTLLYAMAERLGRYVYVSDGMIRTADKAD